MYMVYQLGPEHITQSDYINEWTFYGTDFLDSVADSVDSLVNYDFEYKRLFAELQGYGAVCDYLAQTVQFPKEFLKKYFQQRYFAFQTAVKRLEHEDFQSFCNGSEISSELYRANMYFDDRFRNYVYINDDCITFDAFVREADPAIQYHLGGIVGYR